MLTHLRSVILLCFFCFSISIDADAIGDLITKYRKNKAEMSPVRIQKKSQKKLDQLMKKIVSRSLFERKKSVSQKVLKRGVSSYRGRGIFNVYGTSFGKPGNKGENNVFKDGSKVKWGIITAALPDNSAIGRYIQVRRKQKNGQWGRWIRIYIRDLGPWFRDDPYWLKRREPRAVKYFKKKMKRWDGRVVKNPAGIDLSPWAWQKLGVSKKASMNYSGYVQWRFSN